MRTRAALSDSGGKRPAARAAVTAAALVLCTVPLATPAGAADVAVEDGRLSADLGNAVPIADVLATVAQKTGAKLTVRGELGTARPQSFAGVPLAEALPRLVQPNGLILQFAPQTGGGRKLVAIRAVAPGAAGDPALAGRPQVSRSGDPRSRQIPGLWSYEKGDEVLPSVDERVSRLAKIAQARGEASAAAVIYVLTADPENAVRRSAIGLLAGMRNAEARQALMQAAADADPEVRADSLKALAHRPGDKPVALLTQAAKGDGDPSVRIAAFDLLSASKDGEMARAVLQGAMNDPDPQVRDAAESALRR